MKDSETIDGTSYGMGKIYYNHGECKGRGGGQLRDCATAVRRVLLRCMHERDHEDRSVHTLSPVRLWVLRRLHRTASHARLSS